MGTVKQGWNGRFFEDFRVGDIYRSRLGRTITETDNIQFTMITNNTNQIHFNTHYASRTEFKKPLVNSALTLVGRSRLGRVRPERERLCAGLGLYQAAQSGVSRRYALFRIRGDQRARVEVAACARRREGAHPRRQSERGGGDRIRALDHGVEEGACAADGTVSGDQRACAKRQYDG